MSFTGNVMGFTNALWTGAELLDSGKEDDMNWAIVKLLGNNNPNQLLQTILPIVDLHSFNEVIPSMNDIFISKVNEQNNITGSKSNFTE